MILRDDPQTALPRVLGPLEVQVLEAIWCGPRPTTVRDLQASFPRCAYTTLMTTLDRLHKKGFIQDPRGKAKSVVFTEKGLQESGRLLEEMFTI